MAYQAERFVTLEGIDGSGKSTLRKGLEARFAADGVDVAFTREETETWLGEAVRRSIRERRDPLTTLYLFLADRVQHLVDLRPHVEEGRLIVSDRYHDSTRAYQAVTLADRFGGVEAFERWLDAQVGDWLLVPTRTYLIDVPAEVAGGRLEAARDDPTPYEKVSFLQAVRSAYLRLAAQEPERFLVVDGDRDADVVTDEVYGDLKARGLVG